MGEAAVERLSKIISEPPDKEKGSRSHQPTFEVHIGIAEGWFSLFLLAAVVYSTIWCIQAVGWVDHLGSLTPITALGLIIGVIAAKQRRFPQPVVHLVAGAFGLLFAYWQTAGAYYQGSTVEMFHGLQRWVVVLFTGGTSNDDSIFLLFILVVGFFLAYISAWLVYRVRNPWLMIVANAAVLLINLNGADNGFVVFLIVFLIASLLLLLRFNLYESVRRWQRQGLRYADDIGWDIMQTGALLSIGILVVSWLMPAGFTSDAVAQIWQADANPWVQLENTVNRVISVNGGVNPANHGNFRDTLTLGGNPNLNHDVVLTVQGDDPTQYLASLSYDTYTGRDWVDGPTAKAAQKANQVLSSYNTMIRPVTQNVSIVNPPGEQKAYLLGASEIASVSLPADIVGSKADYAVIAWVNHNGNLTPGMKYKVVSYVSSADINTLRSVPLPKNAPQNPPDYDGAEIPTVYDQAVLHTYLQLPQMLDPRVVALANNITKDAPTMYDKVVALESYLRSNYTYSVNIQLPPGEEDAVSWFLFRSGNKGFCNYFASAMAVMARSIGIPARVVAGYTNGTADDKNHQRVIHGTDAHAWTQIYFAGYGWINFEPSASFSAFTRPLPNQYPAGIMGVTGGNTSGSANTTSPNKGLRGRLDGPDVSTGGLDATAQASSQIRQQVGMALGGFVLLILFACILFALWWQRLFRRYNLPTQLYGRLCMLANWAGIQLKPSQTPYEYVHNLASSDPQDAAVLERLGDIYVRDRWADPQANEHPSRSGEIYELPSLWKRLQPRLFLYVLTHPYFLRWLPQRAWSAFQFLQRRRQARKLAEDEL